MAVTSYAAFAEQDPLGKRLAERRQGYIAAVTGGSHGGDQYKFGLLIGKIQGLDEALQDLFQARRDDANEKGDEL